LLLFCLSLSKSVYFKLVSKINFTFQLNIARMATNGYMPYESYGREGQSVQR